MRGIQRREAGLRLAVSPLVNVEVRDASATGDGSYTISGYAAVYGKETTLYDIPGWWRVRERIRLAAFAPVLERLGRGDGLVHLNHGHDMKTAMAATDVSGVGGLELADDSHGMRFFARADREDPDAKALAIKMGRGIIKQASFAFTIADEERVSVDELDDGTLDELWQINEVGELYDVCVCAQGAYPQTESQLRSLTVASLRVPDLRDLRMDTEDLSTLSQMLQLGVTYIDEQDESDDQANVPAMEGVLTTIAGLVPNEVNENEPADEPEDERAKRLVAAARLGHPRRGNGPGGNEVASKAAGLAAQRAKTAARAKAQVRARYASLTRRESV